MNSLNERLHELVEAEPASPPPIARLLERGRRGRRRRHTGMLALPVVIVAAAFGFAALPHQQPPSTVEAQVDAQVEPRLELVAALGNTEGTSFKVRSTNTKQAGGSKQASYVAESAFDPAATTGYTRVVGDRLEIRLIDGVKYVSKDGDRFVRIEGRSETLGFDAPVLDGELTGSADSQRLFEVLRRVDARVTRTGDRTYHFEATSDIVFLTGDIVLDAQQRIARIAYDYRVDARLFKMHGLLEFSDYGKPVKVKIPSNVVNQG